MRDFKNLNVGIIGSGTMGKMHTLAYRVMPVLFFDCEYIPVTKVLCDVNSTVAAEAANKLMWSEYSDDWKSMVRRDDIDMVDIVTPNNLHHDMAIEACKNRKMVYCEKPLGISTAECQEIYYASHEYGVRTAVGYDRRSVPALMYAKQLIDSGYIGKVVFFRGTYTNGSSLDPLRPFAWRMSKAVSGSGPMGDLASHVIDTTRFLIGDFTEVIGTAATNLKARPAKAVDVITADTPMVKIDVEDTCAWIAHMENGAIATFDTTRMSSGEGVDIRFEVYGDKGALRWNNQYPDELQISTESDPKDKKGFKTVEMCGVHPEGNHLWRAAGFTVGLPEVKAIEVHRFIDAAMNNKEYSPDFYDGMKVNEVIDAVLKSDKTRNWEEIPKTKRL